ncbi:hypothetical protein ABK040_004390 [Willaertia magna]
MAEEELNFLVVETEVNNYISKFNFGPLSFDDTDSMEFLLKTINESNGFVSVHQSPLDTFKSLLRNKGIKVPDNLDCKTRGGYENLLRSILSLNYAVTTNSIPPKQDDQSKGLFDGVVNWVKDRLKRTNEFEKMLEYLSVIKQSNGTAKEIDQFIICKGLDHVAVKYESIFKYFIKNTNLSDNEKFYSEVFQPLYQLTYDLFLFQTYPIEMLPLIVNQIYYYYMLPEKYIRIFEKYLEQLFSLVESFIQNINVINFNQLTQTSTNVCDIARQKVFANERLSFKFKLQFYLVALASQLQSNREKNLWSGLWERFNNNPCLTVEEHIWALQYCSIFMSNKQILNTFKSVKKLETTFHYILNCITDENMNIEFQRLWSDSFLQKVTKENIEAFGNICFEYFLKMETAYGNENRALKEVVNVLKPLIIKLLDNVTLFTDFYKNSYNKVNVKYKTLCSALLRGHLIQSIPKQSVTAFNKFLDFVPELIEAPTFLEFLEKKENSVTEVLKSVNKFIEVKHPDFKVILDIIKRIFKLKRFTYSDAPLVFECQALIDYFVHFDILDLAGLKQTLMTLFKLPQHVKYYFDQLQLFAPTALWKDEKCVTPLHIILVQAITEAHISIIIDKEKQADSKIRQVGLELYKKKSHPAASVIYSSALSLIDVGLVKYNPPVAKGSGLRPFIDYWKERKESKKQSKFDLAYLDLFKDKVESVFETLLENILSNQVMFKDLRSLEINSKEVTTIYKELNMDVDIKEHITKLKLEFNDMSKEYDKYNSVLKWMKKYPELTSVMENITIELDFENKSLNDVQEHIEYIKSQLIDMNEETIEYISFFEKEDSLLFDALFRKSLGSIGNIEDFSKVNSQFNLVLQFLKVICEGNDVTIEQLQTFDIMRIAKEIRRAKKTMNSEISIIKRLLNSSPQSHLNIDMDRLQNALKLQEIGSEMMHLVNSLKNYNMDCTKENSFKDIEEIHNNKLQDISIVKLSEVGHLVETIVKSLNGLQSFHFKYFEILDSESKPLVQFLKDNLDNFDASVGIIRTRTRNDKFDEGLLNSLMVSKQLIEPFLDNSVSFKVLAEKVQALFPEEEDLSKLDNLNKANENLQRIKLLFSKTSSYSLDDIFGSVKTFMETGVYISSLETKELILTYTSANNELQIYGEDLLDFVRIAIFRLSDDAQYEQNAKSNLEDFIQSYRTAQQIHDLILELFAQGHPEFVMERQINIGKKGSIKKEQIHKYINHYEVSLDDWKENIRLLGEEIPQVLKLSQSQLIKLLQLIRTVDVLSQHNVLEPYIVTMFSDEFKYNGEFNLPSAEELHNIITEIRNIQLKPKYELEQVKQFITLLMDLLKLDSRANVGGKVANTTIITDIDLKNKLRLILELIGPVDADIEISLKMGSLVQNGQVMFCNENISKEEMQWFLKRRKGFPGLKYVMVDVDKLSTSIREELIKFEHEVFEKQLAAGETYLLFNNVSNRDAFSFLETKKAELDDKNWKETAGYIRKEYLKSKCKISEITVIHGEAASGKSRYIRKQVEDDESYLRMVVNEDFDSDLFLYKLKEVKENRLFIHFDISTFADYSYLEQFLFNWTICGFIYSAGGFIEKISIDNLEDIRIYFELPKLLNNDVNERQLLQIIDIIKDKKTDALPNFDCSSLNARLVATFMKLYETGLVDKHDIILNVENRLLSSDETSTILNRYFTRSKVTNTNTHRKLFIKLLADKCYQLIRYHNWYEQLDDEDYKGELQRVCAVINSKLFPIFLTECEVMSNDDIKSCWADLPVAFTVFNSKEHLMEFDVIKCPKCKTNTDSLRGLVRVIDIKPDNLEKIRSTLSASLNLLNVPMIDLCEKFNYLLTTDFAIKLLLLNERRKVNRSLILEGDTGCGKTEILRFFAEVLNNNSDIMPDIKYELYLWLQIQLKQFVKQHNIDTNLKYKDINKLNARESIITLLKEIEDQAEEQIVLNFVKGLVKYLANIFEQYSLLKKTEIIDNIINKFKDENIEENQIRREQVNEFLIECEKVRPECVFYKILMHGGISPQEIKQTIGDIVKKNLENVEKYEDFVTVVFIDELNTTKAMGIMKEIFIDHSLDGVKLPKSVFFVGAINPFKKEEDAEFVVNPMAPSMEFIKFDYANLTPKQEEELLKLLLKMEEKEKNLDETKSIEIQELISLGQTFVAEQRLKKIRVSIRDITRANKLYWFLMDNDILYTEDSTSDDHKHIVCLFMAVALAYYFRLKTDRRRKFEEKVDDLIGKQFPQYLSYKFRKVVNEQLDKFYAKAQRQSFIPGGIAKTQAFSENLFCNIVAIQSVTPLLIVGPPGTSKTLSYSVASQKKKGLFKNMKSVHTQHYQCNELSTAYEIELLFKSQVTMKRKFEQSGMFNEICSCFLDEAGLPDSKKNALKVIHYYLDHPEISSVIISNSQLDAAKTNRAIQLTQSDTSFQDLKALCIGCLRLTESDVEKLPPMLEKAIDAICHAFQQVNSVIKSPIVKRADESEGIFHLRDFVYFLRMLRKRSHLYNFTFAPGNIYYALQRNFNGVPEDDFNAIIDLFFGKLQEVFHNYKYDKRQAKSFMEIVNDSINDRLSKEDDPNQSHFRFVMLVDPSETQSSIHLLLSKNILKKDNVKLVYISDFAKDVSDLSLSQEIGEVKMAMEKGECAVFINSTSINSNFYDVFNRHFMVINGKYFANVSIKGKTHPCIVDPQFHCIVHVPLNAYRKLPLPFLNRFEKYIVGGKQFLDEEFRKMKQQADNSTDLKLREKYNVFMNLRNGVNDFVEKFGSSTFYGYVKNETIDSLLIKAINQTPYEEETPCIPSPSTIKNEKMEELLDLRNEEEIVGGSSNQRMKEFIRKVNFLLLQIARPEMLYLNKNIIPKSYLIEYLTRQEHFNALSFLQQAISSHFEKQTEVPQKFIIYSRSTGGIHTLQENERVINEILSPLLKNVLHGKKIEPKDILSISSVSSFSSQLEFKEFLAKFEKEKKGVLILTADMRSVSQQTINYIKFNIDSMLARCSKKYGSAPFVSLIIHFCPEQLQFGNTYDTIFLEWDYYYIDSFQISTESTAMVALDNDVGHYLESRWWFACGVGLFNSVESSDLKLAFGSIYEQLLEKFIKENNLLLQSSHLQRYFLTKGKRTLDDKVGLVKNILKNYKILQNIILTKFSSKWNTKYLSKIVGQICKNIAEGSSVKGILESIMDALKVSLMEFLNPLTRRLMKSISSVEELSKVNDENSELQFKILELIIFDTQMNYQAMAKEKIPLSSILLSQIDSKSKQDLVGCLSIIEKDSKQYSDFRCDMIRYLFDISMREDLVELIDSIFEFARNDKSLRLYEIMKKSKHDVNMVLLLVQKQDISIDDELLKQVAQMKGDIQKIIDLLMSNIISNNWKKIKDAFQQQDEETIKQWLEIDFPNIQKMSLKNYAPNTFKSYKFEILFVLHEFLWFCDNFSQNTAQQLWEKVHVLFDATGENNYLNQYFVQVVEKFATFLLDKPSLKSWLTNIMIFAFSSKQEYWTVPSLKNLIHISSEYDKANDIWSQVNFSTLGSLIEKLASQFIQNQNMNNNFLDMLNETVINLVGNNQSLLMLEEVTEQKQPTFVSLFQRSIINIYSVQDWKNFVPTYMKQVKDLRQSTRQSLSLMVESALDALLLSKLAVYLGENNCQQQIEALDKNKADIIKNIIQKHNKYPLYLLSRAISDDKLESILLCNRAELERIGMGQYHLASIKKDYRSHHFSFMHNQNDPLFNTFNQVRHLIVAGDSNALINYISQFLNNGGNVYHIRLMLVVVPYNYFFLQGQSCPSVMAILQNQNVCRTLLLTAEEQKAVQFFARGPIDISPQKQNTYFALYFASLQHIRSQDEKVLIHLLANITAVSLGVPKDKNHLYNRIFHPEVLADSLGPGSTYNNQNWDCGFTSDGLTIALRDQANIMNRSEVYHAALNTLTWAAFLLCVMFDPERNSGFARNKHMCNYVDQDVVKNVEMTAEERLQLYIKTRVDTFASIFYHSPIILNLIDTTIFFTNSLEEFQRKAAGSDKCLGFFRNGINTQIIREYENFWLNECFIKVVQNYNNIVGEMNAQQQILKTISEFKGKVGFISRKYDCFFANQLSILTESLSKLQNLDLYKTIKLLFLGEDRGEEENKDPYLNKLDSAQFMLQFIKFYISLHHNLNGKITAEDLNQQMKQVVQLISKNDPKFNEVWEETISNWRQYKEKNQQLVVCMRARLAGEAETPELTPDSILLGFINGSGGDDNIGRIIRDLNLAQSNLQGNYNIGNVDINTAVGVNESFNDLLVVSYSSEKISQMVRNFLIINVDQQNNIQYDFDWKGMELLFKEILAFGRPTIKVLDEDMRKSVPFQLLEKEKKVNKEEDQVDENEEEENEHKGLNFADLSHKLNTLMLELSKLNEKFDTLSFLKREKLLSKLNLNNVEEVLLFANDICNMLSAAITYAKEKGSLPLVLKQVLEKSKVKLKNISVNSMNNILSKELCSLGEFGLEVLNNRENIKSIDEQFGKQFKVELPPSARQELEKGKHYLLQILHNEKDFTKIEEKRNMLQTIATILIKDDKKLLTHNKNLEQKIRILFKDQFLTQLNGISNEEYNMFIPENLISKHLVEYVRYLRVIIGRTEIHRAIIVSSGDTYQEKVPEYFGEQIELPNSEAIKVDKYEIDGDEIVDLKTMQEIQEVSTSVMDIKQLNIIEGNNEEDNLQFKPMDTFNLPSFQMPSFFNTPKVMIPMPVNSINTSSNNSIPPPNNNLIMDPKIIQTIQLINKVKKERKEVEELMSQVVDMSLVCKMFVTLEEVRKNRKELIELLQIIKSNEQRIAELINYLPRNQM